MKKLLTLTLITTSCYGTTVTLTLNNVQASPSSNTFVRFELFNYGNNVPQVVGSFSLVPPFVDLYPNSSGIISGNIQGNDTITPANTYYHMTFYNKGVKYYSCDVSITGSSVNLNNSSCMNVTPSPAPNYSGPVPVTLGSASCAPPDAIQSISGGNTTCIPVTSLADTTFITGNGKQTHHVLSVANNTTINIGGLGADPASLNDIFTQSDVGDIIRVIVRNASSLVDYETTIVTVNSTTQAVIALAPTITSTTGEAFWFPPSEDDTTAFQTALNSGVGTIIINKGVVVISNVLTNVRNTTRILGEGSLRSTILLRSSDVSDSFDFTDVIGLNLIGFSVVGPGENSISGGTIKFNLSDFDNWERLYVRDVYLRYLGYSGFVVNTPILSTFIDDKVLYSAGDGFDILGGTTTDFINCYAISNIGPGFNISSASLMGIQGGASETSGIAALVQNSKSITIDHLDIESQIDETPPNASTPLAVVSAGGNLTVGTYYFKFAWMHGVAYGISSAESLVATTTTGNQTITLNLGTVPANVFRARIYSTAPSGGTGNEGYLEDVNVIPATTGTVILSTSFSTVGSLPDFFYQGHGIVVANSSKVFLNNIHSRDLPIAASRHFLITDNSSEVTISHPDIIQGSNTPTYDMQYSSGTSNNELISSLALNRISDSGTNDLIRNGHFIYGNVNAYSLMSGGTKFTASGCANSTTLGGATAGSFVSGTTGTCTVTITFGNTQAGTNGFSCWANDLTTPADKINQTGGTVSTAILSGTTNSGDVINFGCVAY